MHNYQELTVWKMAVDLSVLVYQKTSGFPSDERFGLTNQLRRCSVSISSNIAEGAGRGTDRDFANFLAISAGSTFELETQFLIAKKVGFLPEADYKLLTETTGQIKKMLYALRQKLLS